MSVRRWVAFLWLGTFTLPQMGDAQVVKGQVVDKLRQPVANVYVAVFGEDRDLIRAEVADEDGSFSIDLPDIGKYFLYMTRIGYRSLYDGPYTIGEDGLEIFAVMHPFPIALDGVDVKVEGRVARLEAVGFYERAEQGFGYQLDAEDLAPYRNHEITDALKRIPRVVVNDPVPEIGSARGVLNPEVRIRAHGTSCIPTLYVDGLVAGTAGRPVRPADFMSANDTEAIEVYVGPASEPLQYQALGACGVILLWSRHAFGGGSG